MGKYDTTATDQWLKDKFQPKWREEAAKVQEESARDAWAVVVEEAVAMMETQKVFRFIDAQFYNCYCNDVKAKALRLGNTVLVFVGSTSKLSLYKDCKSEEKYLRYLSGNDKRITNYLGTTEPVACMKGSYNSESKHIDSAEDLLLSVVQNIVEWGEIHTLG